MKTIRVFLLFGALLSSVYANGQDTEDPTVTTCTAPINQTNDAGLCMAAVTYIEPVFEDNVDGAGLPGTLTEGFASGENFPLGETTVTYVYTDVAGNGPAICSFTVTVTDNEEPISTLCPTDIIVINDVGVLGAVVNYTAPEFSDNCEGGALVGTMTSGQASGTIFPIGTTNVIYTYTDASGNVGTCSFDVTVNLFNRAPTVVSQLADLAYDDGFGSVDLPLAGVFADTDSWDSFTYTASSSDAGIVDVSVITNSTLRLTGFTYGIINITVRATDDGDPTLFVEDVFEVDVNGAPTVTTALSDVSEDDGFSNIILDLNVYFSDPENVPLTYIAVSGDAGVVGLTIADNILTISSVSYGVTSVTISASDGSSLNVTDTFDVEVNGAPQVAAGIADMYLDAGFLSTTIDLTSVFLDPEGNPMTYTALSDNMDVALEGVVGNILTITELSYGTTNITVTASDASSLIETITFLVDINGAPVVAAGVNDVSLDQTYETHQVNLLGAFADPENESLTYDAVSADEGIATVNVVGNILTITEQGFGIIDITVIASDGSTLEVSDVFELDVNGAPLVAVGVSDVLIDEGFNTWPIDLTGAFSDPEDDGLSYSAVSDNPAVATANAFGNVLTITEVNDGIANITVTASDGSTLEVSDIFEMYINGSPVISATPLEDVYLDDGFGTTTIDLALGFDDPENDLLNFAAVSSSPGIVAVSLTDSILTLTGYTYGVVNITIICDDGSSLSVQDQFLVDVNGAPVISGTPVTDVSLDHGYGTFDIDVSAGFSDPENDNISYIAESLNESLVTVSVNGDIVRLSDVSYGITTVRVTASDGSSLTVVDEFEVNVNGAPTVAVPLGDMTENAGFLTTTVDISGTFGDPEGDMLLYSAISSNEDIVTVGLVGTTLTITEVRNGSSTITLRASDGSTLMVDNEFVIEVLLPAAWAFDYASYDNNGQISAQVYIDRDMPITGYLGAFWGDECRGVAIASYVSFTNEYVYNLITYSDESSAEYLHFKYYDQLTHTTHEMHDSILFTSDMIVGSASEPIEMHYYLDYQTEFEAGWNWFSMNINTHDENMSLNALLTEGVVQGDYIKNQTVSAAYYSGFGWFSADLTEIEPTQLYKAFFSNPSEISTYGTSIDVANTPILLNNGWTWLGYLPQESMTVSEALGGLLLTDYNYIKNQTSSSTYYDAFNWYGSLTSMNPTEGYMIHLSVPSILVYPEVSSKKAEVQENSRIDIEGFDPYKFEFNGTITARVFLNGEAIGSKDDQLMAYVGDECRGAVSGLYFDPSNAFAYQLMIHSNVSEGEKVSFKYYHAESSTTYLCNERISFNNDMVVADAYASFEINLDNAVGVDEKSVVGSVRLKAYPNPFDHVLQIEIAVPEQAHMHIAIYDIHGRILEVIEENEVPQGLFRSTWNAGDLPNGNYILKVVVDGQQLVRRVTLID